VNLGPQSLDCLRYVKSLGDAAVSVFGNHDFHLLCVAEGVEPKRKRDTLDDVLEAPDRAELLEWLRHRPLMHAEEGWCMVHAGLLPEWNVLRARALAFEVENEMQGGRWRAFLQHMYGDEPARWSDDLKGYDRLRVIVNAMTRMRVVDDYGTMVLSFKGEPGDAYDQWTPWFDYPGRRSADHAIVCGHWSALGLMVRDDVVSLDSGCVWGNTLSAVRLEDRCLFSVPCPRVKGRAA
jgi:bis(5'-nucleosyl)-tetraphosphatase (symmetrical)